MSRVKMHDNEVDIDESLVKLLLEEQFPRWARLPISSVTSAGTDNAIFRLGEDKCVRLPRVPSAAKEVEREQLWLSVFAQTLPLTIPVPVGNGHANNSYPYKWSIFTWIEGRDATLESIADQSQAAATLAEFILALQTMNTTNAPLSRRGVPLQARDQEVHKAINSLKGKIDAEAVIPLWEESLQASAWDKNPVWSHGDLLPSNLLVQNGRLTAVIDFGLMGAGDPACDLIPAWGVFSTHGRQIFRSTLGVDEDTWLRGRGWALSVALIILPYYEKTNPGLVAMAKQILNEILNELK